MKETEFETPATFTETMLLGDILCLWSCTKDNSVKMQDEGEPGRTMQVVTKKTN